MKIMRQILSVLLIVTLPCLSFGQFNKLEKSDSLFKCYKSPVIDSKVYRQLEKDDAIIYIGCYYTTDTTGKVTSQKFIPFNDIGNKYEPSDSIWQSVITALSNASKGWVFKPILWEFKKHKKAEADVNKNPFQRPFTGRPRYFIIVEISGVQEGSSIDKISFIKDFKISQ
jgi:hypothetical protein